MIWFISEWLTGYVNFPQLLSNEQKRLRYQIGLLFFYSAYGDKPLLFVPIEDNWNG